MTVASGSRAVYWYEGEGFLTVARLEDSGEIVYDLEAREPPPGATRLEPTMQEALRLFPDLFSAPYDDGKGATPNPSCLRSFREREAKLPQRELARRVARRLPSKSAGALQKMLSKYEAGASKTLPPAVYEAVIKELALVEQERCARELAEDDDGDRSA